MWLRKRVDNKEKSGNGSSSGNSSNSKAKKVVGFVAEPVAKALITPYRERFSREEMRDIFASVVDVEHNRKLATAEATTAQQLGMSGADYMASDLFGCDEEDGSGGEGEVEEGGEGMEDG